jgi:predicted amidophosphoribosyltransferase
MFDTTTQRVCPHCGRSINWAATRCGFCWLTVSPLTPAEAASAAIPYSNHSEALRLVKERDSATIEALLVERDRLHAEARTANPIPAAIPGKKRLMRDSAAWEDDGGPPEKARL